MTNEITSRSTIGDVLEMSHTLGSTAHSWAILGEGNTSCRIDAESFYVKASGFQLRDIGEHEFARVRFGPILDVLYADAIHTDAQIADLLRASTFEHCSVMPSVETLLHAHLLQLTDINYVGHTHVASVNAMTCSARGWDILMSGGRIFPDEIVVCGIAPCCVPYVDPGLPLARALVQSVETYIETHTCVPKTIYLQNHGFIALGKTANEVISITAMADKVANIVAGTMAFAGPTFLSPASVARISNRPDEHYRRKVLGLG